MQRMHPQVTHTPILPIERHLPLPIDRFVWIQVATVQKACLHLYNGPETLLTNELRHLLRSREEGKLRGTAHQHFWMSLHCCHDTSIRGPVDAKGLFTQQLLPCLNNVHEQLLVKIVWHCTVDRVNHGRVKQINIILRHNADTLKV